VCFFEFWIVAQVTIICKPIDPNLAFLNYVNLEKNCIYIVGCVLELDVDSSNFPNKIPISGDHKPQKTLTWSSFETNVCPPQKKKDFVGDWREAREARAHFKLKLGSTLLLLQSAHIHLICSPPPFLLCFLSNCDGFIFIYYLCIFC
jgi:hypothetical protein